MNTPPIDDLPFDLDAEITSPQLSNNLQLRGLPALSQAAADWRGQQKGVGQPQVILDADQRQKLGASLATALIFKETRAAQDVALLYAVAADNSQDTFVAEMIEELQRAQRVDLFRPAMLLLYRACQAHWDRTRIGRNRVRAELFGENIPDILREAATIPEHFDGPVARETIQKAWLKGVAETDTAADQRSDVMREIDLVERLENADQGAWRGANAWQTLGIGLKDLILRLSSNNGSGGVQTTNACLDYMDISRDVVSTIPAARAWAAALSECLTAAVAGNESVFRRKTFCDGLTEIMGYIQDDEAISLMRSLSVAASKAVEHARNEPTSKAIGLVARRFEEAIGRLIRAHPQVMLEAWIMNGDPWLTMDRKPMISDVRQALVAATVLKESERLAGHNEAGDYEQKPSDRKGLGRPVSSRDIGQFAYAINETIRWAATHESIVSASTSSFIRALSQQLDSVHAVQDHSLIDALADRSDLRRQTEQASSLPSVESIGETAPRRQRHL